MAKKRGRKKGQAGKCGVCGQTGHNARTCPNKSTPDPKKQRATKKKEEKLPTPEELQKELVKVLEKAKQFDLNNVIWKLLQAEPFFAAVSRHIDKKASFGIPTAGVRFNKDTLQFELIYNPVFMGQLNAKEQIDVLKHEFYHIVLDHCTGRMPPDCQTNKEIATKWNFATDLAINSHLEHLPEGCLKPGKDQCKDLPAGNAAEWYYANLPEEMKKQAKQAGNQCPSCGGQKGKHGADGGNNSGKEENNNGSQQGKCPSCGNPVKPGNMPGNGQFDNHDSWCGENSEMDEQTKEFARERMREIGRKAVNEANSQAQWGTVSAETRAEIMKNLFPTIDWRKMLRYFVKTSVKAEKFSTIRRINKRFPYVHAGKRTNRTANLAICIDESGSVGDKMLGQFFAELNKLANFASFTVIPFDHEVAENNIYVWKKGTHKLPQRVRCGGTCFDAPTKYVNKHNFDGVIILTDMCAPKPQRCKVQRMWMTDEKAAANPYFKPDSNEKIVGIRMDTDW